MTTFVPLLATDKLICRLVINFVYISQLCRRTRLTSIYTPTNQNRPSDQPIGSQHRLYGTVYGSNIRMLFIITL